MTSTYFLNCIMGNVFMTKLSPTLPKKVYLGLSSTAPQVDGTGVSEPLASAGYQRVELTNLGEPVNGVVSNGGEIQFDESSASWGTITHFVLFDSPTDGNLLMFNQLSQSRSVETATIVMVKTGSLKLTLANPTVTP
ncbi:hypothetical protein [Acutalibacter muris]|uniref:phage tail fiber protein n=1 Tax=Acutalibacter muris TaxID=1796620 RepID=UPI001C3E896C|nr:hypothetical protein [Acutalibacter muris]